MVAGRESVAGAPASEATRDANSAELIDWRSAACLAKSSRMDDGAGAAAGGSDGCCFCGCCVDGGGCCWGGELVSALLALPPSSSDSGCCCGCCVVIGGAVSARACCCCGLPVGGRLTRVFATKTSGDDIGVSTGGGRIDSGGSHSRSLP